MQNPLIGEHLWGVDFPGSNLTTNFTDPLATDDTSSEILFPELPPIQLQLDVQTTEQAKPNPSTLPPISSTPAPVPNQTEQTAKKRGRPPKKPKLENDSATSGTNISPANSQPNKPKKKPEKSTPE